MIYHYITNSEQSGIAEENIKKRLLSIAIQNPEEFDACMNELKDDGLITCDSRTGLWRAT